MPSIRGIRRSISTTSGLCSAASASASSPSAAVPTSSIPSSSPSSMPEALADDALVVGEQDAAYAGSQSSTRKPSSVGPAFRRPPSSSARSRMPVSP